jgi:hypothetical protein
MRHLAPVIPMSLSAIDPIIESTLVGVLRPLAITPGPAPRTRTVQFQRRDPGIQFWRLRDRLRSRVTQRSAWCTHHSQVANSVAPPTSARARKCHVRRRSTNVAAVLTLIAPAKIQIQIQIQNILVTQVAIAVVPAPQKKLPGMHQERDMQQCAPPCLSTLLPPKLSSVSAVFVLSALRKRRRTRTENTISCPLERVELDSA